ncbi:hypothetical protein TNCV_879911 [Trichonephila clavipes]|nr:hypothetical protein TNCV_879911 [Trichonephila clavipes]
MNYGQLRCLLSLQIYGSSEEYCKTNGAACRQKVFCSSTITPDLAPGDFHLFRYLKYSLGGKLFSDNEEIKAAFELLAVQPVIAGQASQSVHLIQCIIVARSFAG